MVERLGMKLAVVIGAREREMQRYAVALIDRDGDGALHLVDVGVGQDPALDSGEAPPGLPAFIVDRDRPAIGGARSMSAPISSEEHTSELQSLMPSPYAVFCLHTTTHSANHTHAHRLLAEDHQSDKHKSEHKSPIR